MKILKDIIVAGLLIVIAGWLFALTVDTETEPARVTEEKTSEEETADVAFVTGIAGQVTIEPQCPSTPPGTFCETTIYFNGPIAIMVDDPEREVIAQVRTDEIDHFAASVPPGSYVLVAQTDPTKPFPVCQETPAVVEADAVTSVEIMCDSGIR